MSALLTMLPTQYMTNVKEDVTVRFVRPGKLLGIKVQPRNTALRLAMWLERRGDERTGKNEWHGLHSR